MPLAARQVHSPVCAVAGIARLGTGVAGLLRAVAAAAYHPLAPTTFCVSRLVFLDQEVFIDAFSEGQFLSRAELQDILVHIVPDSTNPMYLRATRNSDVWARVLRNLINVFKERNLAPELCGAISLLICQGPEGADSLAQRAIRMQVRGSWWCGGWW